ncbi:NAD(P)/FAD-dependent oxidoreductase [Thermotoga sp. KOL6]|uniref:NAD(P)/FAD-dependent oxidoreductase n=1 Tax=Thermotoga sp. KOL6 TaxID=126741 RepID=UPI000C757123|nr:NAD(P)/FAD-dependent oxidoreductase [Thermotoga sp. KOL6]PLV58726.1 thioredoxin reductase [Thermotoga sp. KOL6]
MRVGIVGAGPAGVASAVFLRRYNVDVVVFEKERVGGLLYNAYLVENFPVFKPLPGKEICHILKERLINSGAILSRDEVIKVKGRMVFTRDESFTFDYVIVASGTLPKRIPDFEVSERVAYEFSKLPDFEKLAIYGAGDIAFDGALNALIKNKEVHVFNRSNRIRAVPLLVKRTEKFAKFFYHENCPIFKVKAEIDGVKLFTKCGTYLFNALLICIGRIPNVSFIEKSENTFVVGDARGGFRQTSIAMGSAVEAAMEILKREGKV